MKNNIEQLLHIAADSSSFEMNDALSFLVGAAKAAITAFRGFQVVHSVELHSVAVHHDKLPDYLSLGEETLDVLRGVVLVVR